MAKKKIDWIKPNNTGITEEDFKNMVHDAEQSKFYSLEEYKHLRKLWRQKKMKK